MPTTPLPAPDIQDGNGSSPIVLSVPHSGRDIPEWLAGRAVGGHRALIALSDPHVDRIVQPLIDQGHGAVVARAPRAAIDPNRRLDELDPLICDCPPPPPGSKAAHGIGLIPSRSHSRRPLWKERLGEAEVARRIESAWRPYHDGLTSLLAAARKRHGLAILLDCHSMPPPRTGLARIVLGDRNGTSADPWITSSIARTVVQAGWDCGLNDPYPGGAIAQIHGDPCQQVHVVQVEIDRSTYLDPTLTAPSPGLGRLQLLLNNIVEDLESGLSQRIAAE